MRTDVPQCRCPQEGIADCVNKDVGIAMALKTVAVWHFYATKPQRNVRFQAVHIVSVAYAKGKGWRLHELSFLQFISAGC